MVFEIDCWGGVEEIFVIFVDKVGELWVLVVVEVGSDLEIVSL